MQLNILQFGVFHPNVMSEINFYIVFSTINMYFSYKSSGIYGVTM